MLRARTWPMPASLARHVEAVWRIEGDGVALDDWLLPEVAGAELGVLLGDPVTIDGAPAPRRLVVGGLTRARRLRHGRAVDTVGIRLAPGCACLLGVPAAALVDVVAPLDAIAPVLDRELAGWDGDVGRLVELLARHTRPRCDATAARAARLLAAGATAIGALAGDLGLSPRQLERRFRAATGTSPRQFVRLARFQRAWELAAAGRASWASIAAAAGYADQPHLDRDFRRLVGLPPSQVFGPGWYDAVDVASVQAGAPRAA